MFMKNKGHTLLEVLITLFLTGIIFLGSALALRALSDVTTMGVNDMTYRRDMNQFAESMQQVTSSLLSRQDSSFSSFHPTNAGVVIEEPDISRYEEDGDVRKYYATKVTLYAKESYQRRVISIDENPLIQENKKLSIYGFLNVVDSQIVAIDEDKITWEDFEVHSPIKIATEQFFESKTGDIETEDTEDVEIEKEEPIKTEFIITTKGDNLFSIKINLLIPVAKGANRQFSMVFTCSQEVAVVVK